MILYFVPDCYLTVFISYTYEVYNVYLPPVTYYLCFLQNYVRLPPIALLEQTLCVIRGGSCLLDIAECNYRKFQPTSWSQNVIRGVLPVYHTLIRRNSC